MNVECLIRQFTQARDRSGNGNRVTIVGAGNQHTLCGVGADGKIHEPSNSRKCRDWKAVGNGFSKSR